MIESKKSTGTVVRGNTEESSESIVDNRNESLGAGRKINKIVSMKEERVRVYATY